MGRTQRQHSVYLLGPQPHGTCLADCLDGLGSRARIVSITAGWQEWEGDVDRLRRHVRRPITDLELHARAEKVFAADPAFFEAYRARQDRLITLQRLYRTRLSHALASVRELQSADAPSDVLSHALRSSISSVRALDRYHLRQVRKVHAEFQFANPSDACAELIRQRERILERIGDAAAVLIAGGHVAVLANRLRLFDLGTCLSAPPVVAWSAGAMLMCSRIVLFHDRPPQGAGDPEVLDDGLGLVRGVVALPRARERLRLDDVRRMAINAQRFSPEICVTLDAGSAAHFSEGALAAAESASRLTRDGYLRSLTPA